MKMSDIVFNFSSKKVLVVGGSRGIGAAHIVAVEAHCVYQEAEESLVVGGRIQCIEGHVAAPGN